jgi:hypothetical protein
MDFSIGIIIISAIDHVLCFHFTSSRRHYSTVEESGSMRTVEPLDLMSS